MARILQDSLDKSHHAKLFSTSGFITAVIIVTAFALPLFLVVNTHNYWVNTATYFEQPHITHMNEILVFLQTDEKVYSFAST